MLSQAELLLLVKCFLLGMMSGCLIALQAVTNGILNAKMASVLWSAAILFGLGFTALLLLALVFEPYHPVMSNLKGVPVWSLVGGLVVGCYLLTITSIAPKLGVPLALLAVILGQIVFAMLIEHFGLLGVSVHAITMKKIIGLALVTSGIYLIRF